MSLYTAPPGPLPPINLYIYMRMMMMMVMFTYTNYNERVSQNLHFMRFHTDHPKRYQYKKDNDNKE
jgi:hypothetical protein